MKFADVNQIIEHIHTKGITHEFLEVIAYDCDFTITTTVSGEKSVYDVVMDIINEFGGTTPCDTMHNAVQSDTMHNAVQNDDSNLSLEDVINYVIKELPNSERFTFDYARTLIEEKAKENDWEFVCFPFDELRNLNDEKEEMADMLAEIANVSPYGL